MADQGVGRIVGELAMEDRGFATTLARGQRQLTAFEQTFQHTGQSVSKLGHHIGNIIDYAFGQALYNNVSKGIAKLKDFARESVNVAARAEQMDVALENLGRQFGISKAAIDGQIAGVRKMGIEMGVAQDTIAQFIRYQLDFTKASKLARVAQDAAIYSGENSSATLQRIIYGIQTYNTETLRTAGININTAQATDKYAKSIGLKAKQLGEAQKQQAILNAVLEEGDRIAGSYEASLASPLKRLNSTKRLFNDIALNVGNSFLPVFARSVDIVDKFGKTMSAATATGTPLRNLLDTIGGIVATRMQPIVELVGTFASFASTIATLVMPALELLGSGLGSVTGDFTSVADIAKSIGTQLQDLFTTLAPGIKAVAEAAGEVASSLGPILGEIGQVLVTKVAPAFAEMAQRLAPALGEILRNLASAAGDALVAALSSLASILQALTPALETFASILANIPVPVLTAAILGLVGALAGMRFGGLIGQVVEFGANIVQTVGGIGQMIGGLGTLSGRLGTAGAAGASAAGGIAAAGSAATAAAPAFARLAALLGPIGIGLAIIGTAAGIGIAQAAKMQAQIDAQVSKFVRGVEGYAEGTKAKLDAITASLAKEKRVAAELIAEYNKGFSRHTGELASRMEGQTSVVKGLEKRRKELQKVYKAEERDRILSLVAQREAESKAAAEAKATQDAIASQQKAIAEQEKAAREQATKDAKKQRRELFDIIQQALRETTGAYLAAQDALAGFTDNLTGLGDALRITIADQKGAVAIQREFEARIRSALSAIQSEAVAMAEAGRIGKDTGSIKKYITDRVKELSAALPGLAQRAREDADAFELLNARLGIVSQGLDRYINIFLAATDAAVSYNEALDNLNDSIAALTEPEYNVERKTITPPLDPTSFYESGKGPPTTEVEIRTPIILDDKEIRKRQRAIARSFTAVVRSIEEEAQALARTGEIGSDTASIHEYMRQRLQEVQAQFPQVAGEAQKYIDRLKTIPADVYTQAQANVAPAMTIIQGFLNELNAHFPKQVAVLVELDRKRVEDTVNEINSSFSKPTVAPITPVVTHPIPFNELIKFMPGYGMAPPGKTPGFVVLPSIYHAGGMVDGQGEVPAVLQAGEGVLPRRSMQKLGPTAFESLRAGRFHDGGVAGSTMTSYMPATPIGGGMVWTGDLVINAPTGNADAIGEVVRKQLLAVQRRNGSTGIT